MESDRKRVGSRRSRGVPVGVGHSRRCACTGLWNSKESNKVLAPFLLA